MSGTSTTFCWDFFGPRAEGTARHFQRHLDERLASEAVTGETAVETPAGNQWTVRCALPGEHVERLRAALRPRREEPR